MYRYLNAKGYEGGFQKSELDSIFKAINQNFSSWVHTFAPVAVGVNDLSAISEFEESLGRMKPKVALSVAKTVFLTDLRGSTTSSGALHDYSVQKGQYCSKIYSILHKEKAGYSFQDKDSEDKRSFSSAHSLPFTFESS